MKTSNGLHMAKICKHFIISGRVQGVFFRDSTRKKAQEFQITGWVRNTHDGNVELIACGNEDAIHHLQEWLNHGPPQASVKKVVAETIDWQEHENFSIRYD